MRAGSSLPRRTSKCPETNGRPALLPLLTAEAKSELRRIRAVAGSMAIPPQSRQRQTLTRARPFRRLAARIARPARVRMRRRNPWVFARRRLFG
jgi:hypothetical protein